MEIFGPIVAGILALVGLAAGVVQVISFFEERKRHKLVEVEAPNVMPELDAWEPAYPELPRPTEDSTETDEQWRRIRHVLRGVGEGDRAKALAAWQRHTRRRLIFPFEAKVNSPASDGATPPENVVLVRRVIDVDQVDGVIVQVMTGDGPIDLPLGGLSALNHDWPNHQLIDDYCTWLAGSPSGDSSDGD